MFDMSARGFHSWSPPSFFRQDESIRTELMHKCNTMMESAEARMRAFPAARIDDVREVGMMKPESEKLSLVLTKFQIEGEGGKTKSNSVGCLVFPPGAQDDEDNPDDLSFLVSTEEEHMRGRKEKEMLEKIWIHRGVLWGGRGETECTKPRDGDAGEKSKTLSLARMLNIKTVVLSDGDVQILLMYQKELARLTGTEGFYKPYETTPPLAALLTEDCSDINFEGMCTVLKALQGQTLSEVGPREIFTCEGDGRIFGLRLQKMEQLCKGETDLLGHRRHFALQQAANQTQQLPRRAQPPRALQHPTKVRASPFSLNDFESGRMLPQLLKQAFRLHQVRDWLRETFGERRKNFTLNLFLAAGSLQGGWTLVPTLGDLIAKCATVGAAREIRERLFEKSVLQELQPEMEDRAMIGDAVGGCLVTYNEAASAILSNRSFNHDSAETDETNVEYASWAERLKLNAVRRSPDELQKTYPFCKMTTVTEGDVLNTHSKGTPFEGLLEAAFSSRNAYGTTAVFRGGGATCTGGQITEGLRSAAEFYDTCKEIVTGSPSRISEALRDGLLTESVILSCLSPPPVLVTEGIESLRPQKHQDELWGLMHVVAPKGEGLMGLESACRLPVTSARLHLLVSLLAVASAGEVTSHPSQSPWVQYEFTDCDRSELADLKTAGIIVPSSVVVNSRRFFASLTKIGEGLMRLGFPCAAMQVLAPRSQAAAAGTKGVLTDLKKITNPQEYVCRNHAHSLRSLPLDMEDSKWLQAQGLPGSLGRVHQLRGLENEVKGGVRKAEERKEKPYQRFVSGLEKKVSSAKAWKEVSSEAKERGEKLWFPTFGEGEAWLSSASVDTCVLPLSGSGGKRTREPTESVDAPAPSPAGSKKQRGGSNEATVAPTASASVAGSKRPFEAPDTNNSHSDMRDDSQTEGGGAGFGKKQKVATAAAASGPSVAAAAATPHVSSEPAGSPASSLSRGPVSLSSTRSKDFLKEMSRRKKALMGALLLSNGFQVDKILRLGEDLEAKPLEWLFEKIDERLCTAGSD
uniref:Uncharacterized protein n=1 Tax=Chromera velia CCMP2878 TaxID=1169474 RepID=A0A0G4HVJ6_9ALVE|eukprot:Cvel_8871.t1-p1 / transcript=Cvel_8871.t1 / gene=Cvel_8871 / organism=Chromera_velia_CCMP2878 / gene_product=hypothetical protein / transcript_product=hypothetical protein / location=Cvel_scaffold499:15431-19872(+) / protein_length=1030 / sequence_SO=supercontig / SO=protein_coding / is_pseudo=false